MTINKAILDASMNDQELRRLVNHSPLASMCLRMALEDPEATVWSFRRVQRE